MGRREEEPDDAPLSIAMGAGSSAWLVQTPFEGNLEGSVSAGFGNDDAHFTGKLDAEGDIDTIGLGLRRDAGQASVNRLSRFLDHLKNRVKAWPKVFHDAFARDGAGDWAFDLVEDLRAAIQDKGAVAVHGFRCFVTGYVLGALPGYLLLTGKATGSGDVG